VKIKQAPSTRKNGGAKINGDPVQGVRSQGALGSSATCRHSQELSPGLRELHATGDSTAPGPSTASQPTRRATPVMMGVPPSAPLGPSPPSRSRRERKLRARLAKFAHSTEASSQSEPTETSFQLEPAGPSSQQAMEPTGPPSHLTPSTSRGIPDHLSVEPEAKDTGALTSSSAAESEEVSEGSSEVEDSQSAESGPTHLGPAKGGTGGRSGTAAGMNA